MQYHLLQLSLVHPLPWRMLLFAAYTTALAVQQTVPFWWRITEQLFGKDLEGFGHDLSWGTIPLFVWRPGGKPQRNLTVRIRTHHLQCHLSWFVRRGFWQAYFAVAIVLVKAPCFEGWLCCHHQARRKKWQNLLFWVGRIQFFGPFSWERIQNCEYYIRYESEYLFRARPRALDGARPRACQGHWSLSFIDFTVNPPLSDGFIGWG